MPAADQPAGSTGTGRRQWYLPAWLEVPGLPVFEVIDTRSAQGRLDHRPKRVTVADLVLFHGHACDGLLRGAWAMRALCDAAFGAAPLDRSDLLAVSRNSPCLGDVAAYLTGGRARFGTHRLDPDLGAGFQIRKAGGKGFQENVGLASIALRAIERTAEPEDLGRDRDAVDTVLRRVGPHLRQRH
jgi:hypothetical protein